MLFLLQTFNILVQLLITLIFIRVVLSWMVRDFRSPLMHLLLQCTEPILGPVRRILPMVSGFDFSPLVSVILLETLRNILNQWLL